MIFKSLRGLAPEYVCSKFVHRESAYRLRDSVNKVMFRHNRAQATTKTAFISYSGAVLWNSLPLELRKEESLNQFKRLIKEAI